MDTDDNDKESNIYQHLLESRDNTMEKAALAVGSIGSLSELPTKSYLDETEKSSMTDFDEEKIKIIFNDLKKCIRGELVTAKIYQTGKAARYLVSSYHICLYYRYFHH